MNRPLLITLRLLAVGSALTVITCTVVRQQQLANPTPAPGSGGQGAGSGKPAEASAAPRTFMAGSKSAAALKPSDLTHVTAPPGRDGATEVASRHAEAVTRQLKRANGFFDLGQYTNAEQEFRQALALDPGNVEATAGLRRCREELSKPPPPRFAPGSKSAPMVTPQDAQRIQQQISPSSQQSARP